MTLYVCGLVAIDWSWPGRPALALGLAQLGCALSALAVCEGGSGKQSLTCNGLKQVLTGPESGVGRTPEPSAWALERRGRLRRCHLRPATKPAQESTTGRTPIRLSGTRGLPSGYRGSGDSHQVIGDRGTPIRLSGIRGALLSLVFKLRRVSVTHEVLVAF